MTYACSRYHNWILDCRYTEKKEEHTLNIKQGIAYLFRSAGAMQKLNQSIDWEEFFIFP